jgi:HSP20 family molecular chaperone IbpA
MGFSRIDGSVPNIEIDAPGFAKSDFKITLNNENILDINASSSLRPRKLCLRYKIDDYVDASSISASYESGVLTLHVKAKQPSKEKRNIEVT